MKISDMLFWLICEVRIFEANSPLKEVQASKVRYLFRFAKIL